MKKGVLYVNLGTPQSPSRKDVARYLREFLMDPLVIDIAAPLRALLVYGVIVPFRASKSAHAYQQIWTSAGSPLLVNSLRFVEKLRAQLGPEVSVELGMRYGQPSLESALEKLLAAGVEEIRVLTAYPQYALSSTETAFQQLRQLLKRRAGRQKLPVVRVMASYEARPEFTQAYAQNIREVAQDFQPDFYLFSYHGLPLRHLQKQSRACTGGACSLQDSPENRLCYRRQSFGTTAALTRALGLSAQQYEVGFQSRLDDGWIQPYSDHFYRTLPSRGVKKLLVACPSFTADCLETLEEVGLRAREEFLQNGGEELKLVPCLNADDLWVSGAQKLLAGDTGWTVI